ncbi:MAG: dihydropyrimidinase [Bacteroidales bacterium]|nr:dihydropyrimidinase [Bacteroidales bacterium]MDY0197849.1 dihydropyrimidinase [Tenuifilaceae bacterium]
MSLLIRNAHIVNPDRNFDADIVIDNGKILSIENYGSLSVNYADIIDAEGMLVIPGGVDPHVHLALPTPAGPSADDFITGSQAALAGGVTHLIDFVTPNRGQNLCEALRLRQQEAKDCSVGLNFHMGISNWLPDMEKQMEICVKEYGIKSFKTYLAYRQSIGIDYEALEKIMRIAAKLKIIVLVHSEEGDMIDQLRSDYLKKGMTHPKYHALSRPPESESNAVKKVIELVAKTNCTTYFVHISTAESANYIAQAKKSGLPIYAETCPHYLLLDDEVYEGTSMETIPFVFSPPARPAHHKKYLWDHLQQGTFDTVATDHCPFNMQQKMVGKENFTLIPNGAGGLEFRIPLLYHFGVLQSKISLQQWIKYTSTNAASIFGLKSKGSISIGNEADMVIFNPTKVSNFSSQTNYQNCDINIYEGITVTGSIKKTIKEGIIAFEF